MLYFSEDAIRSTRISDASVEVRLHCDESGPLHATDGVIARMARLLSSDREGYRKLVQDDRQRPGHYHTATIASRCASELLTGHELPKEVKHYYDDDAPRDLDHPLAHPKLCVSYQTSLDDSKPSDRDRVVRELHEVLLNVLRWAGFPVEAVAIDEWDGPTEADCGPYVEDAFWAPETDRLQRRLPSDPLPEIRDEQESLVIRHLADGLEDSDFDVLDRLVEDGGEVAPQDLATSEGWHLNTIYRALDRLGELVEHRYGEVHLASSAVAEQVAEKARWAREVASDAVETAASALERIEELDSGGDRVAEWFERNASHVQEVDDELEIDLGPFGSDEDALQVALAELRYRWGRAGLPARRLLGATVRYSLLGDRRQRTVATILNLTIDTRRDHGL